MIPLASQDNPLPEVLTRIEKGSGQRYSLIDFFFFFLLNLSLKSINSLDWFFVSLVLIWMKMKQKRIYQPLEINNLFLLKNHNQ